MMSGFRSIKQEARAKTRAMYEAANPFVCSKCSRRFPKLKSLNQHHYTHIWKKSSAVKDLGQSSSQRQQSVPPAATPVLPTPLFVEKSARQLDVNSEKSIWETLYGAGENGDGNKVAVPVGVNLQSEKSIWKPLHVAGEHGDGHKVAVPVGVNLQFTAVKTPAESTGVDAEDETKETELDLSLHL